MDIKQLQEHYLKDININERDVTKLTFSLPNVLNKYQIFYFDTLNKVSELYDKKEKTYYDILIEYKLGKSDLSNISLSSTELKRMLESTVIYRELNTKLKNKENELKLVEEMMSNIKSISWGIKNYIDYMKLKLGEI